MDQLLGKSIVFDNTATAKMIHICRFISACPALNILVQRFMILLSIMFDKTSKVNKQYIHAR